MKIIESKWRYRLILLGEKDKSPLVFLELVSNFTENRILYFIYKIFISILLYNHLFFFFHSATGCICICNVHLQNRFDDTFCFYLSCFFQVTFGSTQSGSCGVSKPEPHLYMFVHLLGSYKFSQLILALTLIYCICHQVYVLTDCITSIFTLHIFLLCTCISMILLYCTWSCKLQMFCLLPLFSYLNDQVIQALYTIIKKKNN